MYSKLFIICFLFALPAVPSAGAASHGEAVIAGWERAALQRIHGERVIESVTSAHRGVLLLDARSDDRAFAELRAARRFARAALESGLRTGLAAAYLRAVLVNAGTADIAPLGTIERELCGADMPIAVAGAVPCGLEAAPGGGEARWGSAFPAVAAPGGKSYGKRDASRWISSTPRPPRFLAANINIRDYRCDSAKVNYWRLYLYRWEDLPWEFTAWLTVPPLARASARANVSISPRIFKEPKNHPGVAMPGSAPVRMFRGVTTMKGDVHPRPASIPIQIIAAPSLPCAPLTSKFCEVSV
ncbi:MAG TPA: hypothetical protein VLM75_09815 [Spirochaetota bacterium]|nr:hypothetical protein [Spirochaetota bacterium]